MDFRNVYSVSIPISSGEIKSAEYINDSTGTTIWSTQGIYKFGQSLIKIAGTVGTKTYTLDEDVTVVGRYGDPGDYGAGTLAICQNYEDVKAKKYIVYHTDPYANRKSIFYRCKKGMVLVAMGGGKYGLAMWNVLGNYRVVVKNQEGKTLTEDEEYSEYLQYNVYRPGCAIKIGTFNYSWLYSWRIVVNTSAKLLLSKGSYSVVLIGGGGGGAWSDTGSSNDGYQKATGGGGAGIKGTLTLGAETEVSAIVGSAGKSSGTANYHTDGSHTGSAGGNTVISIGGKNVAVAEGGTGGHCRHAIEMENWGGSGGAYTCDTDYVTNFSKSVNGNSGNSVGEWNSIPSDVAYASGPFSEYEYGFSGGNAKKAGDDWVEAQHASKGVVIIS